MYWYHIPGIYIIYHGTWYTNDHIMSRKVEQMQQRDCERILPLLYPSACRLSFSYYTYEYIYQLYTILNIIAAAAVLKHYS